MKHRIPMLRRRRTGSITLGVVSVWLAVVVAGPAYAQTFTRITDAGPISSHTTGAWGSSWGDVNADGWMDLFVVGQPNALYVNDGDGTFRAVTTGHAVTFRGNQNSAVWSDVNNDGYADLYVSHLGPGTPVPPGGQLNPRVNFLYLNDGPPNYTLARVESGDVTTSLNMTWTSTWTDYDNDGDLDLFVGGDQGDIDLFYTNDGTGRLTQVTDAPFIRAGAFSAGGSWIDVDNDGDEDLLVVNFMGTNNELYRNQLAETGTATFERVFSDDIVRDSESDLVPSWGDYDNDGDLDAFMCVWYNRDNILFRNDGDMSFTRIQQGIVVRDQGLSLGNAWLDYDNDGDLDLFVVDQQSVDRLYRNDGDGTFTKMTGADVGALVTTDVGFASGASVADYDNDGDLDVFIPISGSAAGSLLFRNDGGNANHWLHVTTVGTTSNRAGVGAKVRVKATIGGEAVWQMRYIPGGPTGDRAQNSQRAHFGLGDATTIDSLQVEWPSGTVDVYTNVAADQFFVATEGEAVEPVANEAPSGLPASFELGRNYPNPFYGSTTIAYRLPEAAFTTLRVYDVLGREVAVPVQARQPAGTHTVQLDLPATLPAGFYVYRLTAGRFSATRTMTRVR